MAVLQTTQHVNVAQHRAQQIQVCTVTSQTINVVLFRHALKPMVLLQTTQRVNVAQHRALQIQVYNAPNQSTPAILNHHALISMARHLILQPAYAEQELAQQPLGSSVSNPHQHVLALPNQKIAEATRNLMKTHRTALHSTLAVNVYSARRIFTTKIALQNVQNLLYLLPPIQFFFFVQAGYFLHTSTTCIATRLQTSRRLKKQKRQ